MLTMEMESAECKLSTTKAAAYAKSLREQGWVFLPGAEFQDGFSLSLGDWLSFALYWDNLVLDGYMGDKGAYRYRRYSSFEVNASEEAVILNPHEAYVQPRTVNPLNGDVERHYLPLEQGMVTHPFFQALLLGLARVYDLATGQPVLWNVKLHPYRIKAENETCGKPTPEGLHRDGVDFIAMMLVARYCVRGGETTVTNNRGEPIFTKTMSTPLDIILGDDHQVMHQVSPIHCTEQPGYRDALVIAFTRSVAYA